eukprot:TRINITY_DN12225_c3_g1_i3.p1 TRINITY_DN12225_c3_g1~~TRINITY_DN12225_c3_g1_i3.p1  ORF type:complete len:859 (+),score=205.07 TRINITY_DN12225_c3_g1_i3:92-2668(+)
MENGRYGYHAAPFSKEAPPGERRWKALQALVCGDAERLRREIRISLKMLQQNSKGKNTSEKLQHSFNSHLHLSLGKTLPIAHNHDFYVAVAMAVRDQLMQKWIASIYEQSQADPKRVYYLSMEYLIGRTLQNAAVNLDMDKDMQDAMHQLGLNMEQIIEEERDAGLGNGGLGRLAACYMDSAATLNLACMGYGLRYEYGIFQQQIDDEGRQVETPDDWLTAGNVWEIPRPEFTQLVHFYGRVEVEGGRRSWTATTVIEAVPFDHPVPGYHCDTVNMVRLWAANSNGSFQFDQFQSGNYIDAVLTRNLAESITRVLYPNDSEMHGKELRLKQEYMLVSASLQDIICRYKAMQLNSCDRYTRGGADLREDMSRLPEKVVLNLNDTHPALAVPELMRLLLDTYCLGWEEAWDVTQQCCAYTNHTLLPEALEFLDDVVAKEWPHDGNIREHLSIVEERPHKCINMAKLAVVACFAVNGVAAVHSKLLTTHTFPKFYQLYPDKFRNKTNGVTPRRWLLQANPELAKLLFDLLGKDWPKDLGQLSRLEEFQDDEAVLHRLKRIQKKAKKSFAAWVESRYSVQVDSKSMFDVQIKRIHEYKRQLMNTFHAIHLYLCIKDGQEIAPRTIFIGGKAAPGYKRAKEIVQFTNCVARVINSDPETNQQLKLVFLTNYDVSVAEKAIPAADVCQQISTAGKEASGTSNMKFMMNGALIVGTLDGANVEILERVGSENFYLFGHTIESLDKLRSTYKPREALKRCPELQAVFAAVRQGRFTSKNGTSFNGIVDDLLKRDEYFVIEDFPDYLRVQQQAARDFAGDATTWYRRVLMNIAQSGFFSSDRAIQEYNEDMWHGGTVVAHSLCENEG